MSREDHDKLNEEWHLWLNSMIQPPQTVASANTNVANFNNAVQQQYQTAISNQLNNPLPYITMPPAVANTIEPFKVYVVERYDNDMELMIVMGVFTNANDAAEYAKANGNWEYEIHEFTLDSEVPVEEE